jgi:hypothetical protein
VSRLLYPRDVSQYDALVVAADDKTAARITEG